MAPAVTCSASPACGLSLRASPDLLPQPSGGRPMLCCVVQGLASERRAQRTPASLPPTPPQSPGSFQKTSLRCLYTSRPPFPASASGRSPAWVAQARPSMAVGSLVPGKAAQRGSCRSDAGMGSHGSLWKPTGLSPRLRGGARVPVSRGSRKPRAGEGRGARSGVSHAATLPVSRRWVGASLVHVLTWARACAEEASPPPAHVPHFPRLPASVPPPRLSGAP